MIDKTFDYKKFKELVCQNKKDTGKPFMILLPPPNVTGSLHIGHSLCFTLQDILARYKRLRGYNVLFQPGLDHAGIVTQLLVEKQLAAKGISRKELGREKFMDEVWSWKKQSGDTILNQMKVLGISCDFDKLHFTMDSDIQKAVSQMFVNLYNDGLIFKDRKLINWDPKIQSAISDLEVIEKEENGNLWHIKYAVEGSDECLVVATSRPETLFGDSGIAVHPEDERYKHLVGKFAIIPIINKRIPIVADAYAAPEKGTGAVKITPAHDFNDFEVGKRHDLEIINILSEDATLNSNVPNEYVGLDRFDARKKIIDQLKELDILVQIEKIKHKVPYSDRSGVIIEPYITDQWFIDVDKLAEPAIKAIESGETQFIPRHWENLYYEWMKNIRPWCISRQIWWGHRIPVWYGPDGKMFVCESAEKAYEAAKETYGDNRIKLVRDPNVLDTWFSSGMWPFSTLGWPNKTPDLQKFYSNSVVVTGFDIIFFWIARMMMFGIYATKKSPFKHIYIHGLVRDEKGQKMSKSKGNVIDPLDLCNEYGADAVRFTLAYLSSPGRDVKINKASVETGRNFLTKMWNAVRYAEMSGCKKSLADFDESKVKSKIAKWLVVELEMSVTEISQALDDFRFDDGAKGVYKLIWGIFCDWYLELSKPILQSESNYKDEILKTTSWALGKITSVLYVFAPFISSTLHHEVCDGDISWPEIRLGSGFHEAAIEINLVRGVISEIRSLRKELDIPASQVVDIFANNEVLLENKEIIQRLAKVQFIPENHNGMPVLVGHIVINVMVRNLIDIDNEIIKIEHNIADFEKEKANLEKRLSNAGFIAKASADVIDEHRTRLSEIHSKLAKSIQLKRDIENMSK